MSLFFALVPTTALAQVITLDSSTHYQTWKGWGAYPYACSDPGDCPVAWPDANIPNWALSAYDTAVNDLGITEIYLSTFSNQQHTTNFWDNSLQVCNANGWNTQICRDAFQCVSSCSSGLVPGATYWHANLGAIAANSPAFHFDQLDWQLNTVAIPLRNKIIASGQTPFISIRIEDRGYGANGNPANYSFCGQSNNASLDQNRTADLGNFWTAVYNHIQTNYGFVPDVIDVVNEPDTAGPIAICWRSGANIGNIIKTVGDSLTANGFTARIVAPSTGSTANAASYFDGIWAVTGARQYITGISFHEYGGLSDQALSDIGARATTNNIDSFMNELYPPDYNKLHKDIKLGMVSNWDGMYPLLGPTKWGGNAWLTVTDDSSHIVAIPGATYFIRQYSKFIRPGAVRIDAATNDSNFDPVAFINSDGNYAVVVKVALAGSFSVQGLPAGTYGIKYTTTSQYDKDLSDVVLQPSQTLTASIPSTGVITVYSKTASGVSCGDTDGDGYYNTSGCGTPMDCNDNNPNVYQTISCSYNGASCGQFSLCQLTCPTPPAEICGNSIDDDCDFLTDCSDPDCSASCPQQGKCTGLILLHHYDNNPSFGENSTYVYDFSGNGNNGTCANCPTWIQNGKFAGTYSFDGINDAISVLDSALLSPTVQMTFSAWVYQNSLPSVDNDIAAKWGTNQETWLVRTRNVSGQGSIWVNIAPTLTDLYTTKGSTPTGSWAIGQWHHLAFTYNGSGAANADRLKIYRDGQLQTLAFTGTIPASLTDSTAGVLLGGLGAYLNGSIDELAIWNRSLTSQEIQSLYSEPVPCGAIHRADSNSDNCVDNLELFAFIDKWKINSSDVSIREIIEAIGLWKIGC